MNTIMNTNIINALADFRNGRPLIVLNNNKNTNVIVSGERITKGTIDFIVDSLNMSIFLAVKKNSMDFNNICYYYLSTEDIVRNKVSSDKIIYSIKSISNTILQNKNTISKKNIFNNYSSNNVLINNEYAVEIGLDICEITKLQSSVIFIKKSNMSLEESLSYGRSYNIPIIKTSEIKQYKKENTIKKAAEATLPTKTGIFKITSWENYDNLQPHVSLSLGEIQNMENVPIRIHSECLTGDVFHSLKCDCGDQLNNAMKYISKKGIGILILLRQEGRGIGLTNKIKAYKLQETKGLNTIDANIALGLPVDTRTYEEAIKIIKSFNPKSIELITNNPDKIEALSKHFKVTRKQLLTKISRENKEYLKTKELLMHHLLKIKKEDNI